ncbi:hypothetical protein M426DRAFT_245573 [Hypoxylon sp. CI-4A]|nr:hypothetical protein M426DRAFT_245573 [Hypoxylon sp. CI-4A]
MLCRWGNVTREIFNYSENFVVSILAPFVLSEVTRNIYAVVMMSFAGSWMYPSLPSPLQN